MTTFEDAKVDDRVFDIKHGWGLISKVFPKNMRPITVQFSKYDRSYMFNGKYSETDRNQVLFWDEVIITPPSKPLPKLEVDTKVLVWDEGRDTEKRHFSHFSDSGRIHVFIKGTTSWTCKKTVSYPCWELAGDYNCK